jgi:AsmA protein
VKTFLKPLAIGAGILIVLLIAAAIIVPRVVDINNYKDQIAALVEKQTGRELKIQGDISLSVFPWLEVKTGAIELGNAKGFDAPLFAQVKQLKIRVRILPLLSRKMEAGVVTLKGLAVNLERNKEGITNWEDLVAKAGHEEKHENVGKKPPITGAIAIGGMDVHNASISWNDQTSGQHVVVSDLFIESSAITLINPIDVKLGFTVDTGTMGLTGKVDTGSQITIDLNDQIYTIKDLVLNAELKGKALPDGRAMIKGEGDLAFDAGARRINLSRFKLSSDGLSLPPYTAAAVFESSGSGDLAESTFDLPDFKAALTMTEGKKQINTELSGKFRADLKTQKLTVSELALSLPEFSTDDLRIQLSAPQKAVATFDLAAMTLMADGLKLAGTISRKSTPGDSIPVELGLRVHGDLNQQTLSVESMKLKALGMTTEGSLSVSKFKTDPKISGSIKTTRFNPRELLDRLIKDVPETADPKALSSAELSFNFTAGASTVKVDKLAALIDDSKLTGSAAVNNFAAPDVRFDLDVDRIDTDRYLQPKQTDKATAAATIPGTQAAALPADTLKALNLDGKLTIGKLKITNIRLQDIKMQAIGKDGLVTMSPFSATLYGGAVNGTVTIDARGEQLQISLVEKLANVQAGPFLKDFQGRSVLTGLTNADIALTATGDDSKAITQRLNGKIDFRITDGRIEKLDIAGKICRALSGVSTHSIKKEDIAASILQMVTKQGKDAEAPSDGSTDFSEMGGSMVFTNGIGTNNDLTLKSPLLRVEGAGKINLPEQHLDYEVTAILVKSCDGQGGKSSSELTNYPIPVTISGPLENLHVKPNITAGILKVLQKKQPTQQNPAEPSQQPTEQNPDEPSQPQQPVDSKKQPEDAVKDILQKGIQDLFKKK